MPVPGMSVQMARLGRDFKFLRERGLAEIQVPGVYGAASSRH